MLTPLDIQVAIIKAFYALAKKSVKYYTGLALGKNNTCLFKEIRLLRAYIEILKNFEIVGSTITCCCSVEGDYTVLLNSDLPVTNTPIQFGCDNQGYMVYNNVGYPFTYWYDEPNNKIVIKFTSDAPNPNLVSNSDMTYDLNGWIANNFTWNGYGLGSALYIGEGSDAYLSQDILEVGKSYIVSFDIFTEFDATPNNCYISLLAGITESVIFDGEITNTETISTESIITCFGGTELRIFGNLDNGNANFYIKNVVAKEIVGTTITVTDVEFTPECNILGNANSPIEVAEIEVINHPSIEVDNIYGTWNGNISILAGLQVVYESLPIPVAIMNDPIAIVEWWATNGIPGWILLYNVDHFVIYSPFNDVDYSTYTAQFNQYEGGTDATLGFDLSGLPPFVNVNTPAYADILFKQPTFVGSRIGQTPPITVPATLPYIAAPEPATVDILIPLNQFVLGQPATMTIPLYSLFYSSYQDFKYQDVSMFSNLASLTTLQDVITVFNNNNGLGFTASDGGNEPINETLATSSNALNFFNTGAFDDLYIAKLITPSGTITIGQYTVGDDSPEDIAAYLAIAIIEQGDFVGTVSVNGTVITLTAPLGSGASWNNVYKFNLQKGVSGRAISYPFSGGVGTPTEPVYILNITAPNAFPQENYNGGVITIEYPSDGYEPDGGQFVGAVNDSSGAVIFTNDYPVPTYIYDSSILGLFTNIEDMLVSFDTYNTLGAYSQIIGTDGLNYIVRITIPSPPNPSWDYNGTNLNYLYSFPFYTYDNVYSNGRDLTTSTYTLTVYNTNLGVYRTITNTGNYETIEDIINDINADPTFNTIFIGYLGDGNDIYFTTFNNTAFYNYYTFQLEIDYASLEYTSNYFMSTIVPITGGINLSAPAFTLVNNYTSTTILSLALNSYEFFGINDFINYFNTLSPYNYTASYQGVSYYTPPIYPVGTLTIPLNYTILPNSTLTVVGTTLTPNPLCTYVPIVGNTVGQVAIGLSNAINAGAYAGSAAWGGNLLQITGPPTPSNPAFYNGTPLTLYKTEPALRATANVVVVASEDPGGVYVGPFAIRLSMGITSLGTFLASPGVTYTPIQIANAYSAIVNSGTSSHGYSAVATGQGGLTKIRLTAPVNTGSSLNGYMPTISIDSQNILLSPPGAFAGGTDVTSVLATATLNNGRFTAYDTVRFTADPEIYTWEYSDNSGTLTYTNTTNSFTYPGTFIGGYDNTAGQLALLLTNPPPIYPNPFYTLYTDGAPVNYTSFNGWVNAVNNSVSNLDFSASVLTTDFTIHAPENSFAYFNDGPNLELFYTYASPQWSGFNYDQELPIENGVNPTLTPYEGTFVSGVLGDFINSDPCAPTTVTQTCLSNAQVSKIITHINKLIK